MSHKLAVSEHFYSIQGEGKYMGVPAVFLRLSGCNLMCGGQGTQFDKELHNGATWRCDTIEVWMKGQSIPSEELLYQFRGLGYLHKLTLGAHLVITGGEPTLQTESVIDFLDTLKKEVPHLFVEVETNGTIKPSDDLVSHIDHWNVSPKLANSGNPLNARLNREALDFFTSGNISVCFKLVVGNNQEAKEGLEMLYPDLNGWNAKNIYFMPPCESVTEYEEVAPKVAELAKQYCVNFSTRLQINLWDKTTGV